MKLIHFISFFLYIIFLTFVDPLMWYIVGKSCDQLFMLCISESLPVISPRKSSEMSAKLIKVPTKETNWEEEFRRCIIYISEHRNFQRYITWGGRYKLNKSLILGLLLCLHDYSFFLLFEIPFLNVCYCALWLYKKRNEPTS